MKWTISALALVLLSAVVLAEGTAGTAPTPAAAGNVAPATAQAPASR